MLGRHVALALRVGPAAIACLFVGCTLVAIVWPGQNLSDRAMDFAYGAVGAMVSYLFFHSALALLASRGSVIFGRLAYWYTVFAFYFGLAAVPLALISLPFQWRDLNGDGMTAPMFLATVPSGWAAAFGIAKVLNKYYVWA